MTEEQKVAHAKMKQYFKDKQAFFIEERAIFKQNFEQARTKTFTPYRQYSAFGFIVFDELADILNGLESVFEGLIEMDKDIADKTQRLERIIQDVGNQVGADMTNVKAELSDLKSTIKEPMVARVYEFIQVMKENAEKRKSAGDPYVE
jgi:hypothetical protein